MTSFADFDEILKELMGFLSPEHQTASPSQAKNEKDGKECFNLSPTQWLVIAGILAGTLAVESLVINSNQTIRVILGGDLKRKTELEKMLGQVGKVPLEKFLKAFQ